MGEIRGVVMYIARSNKHDYLIDKERYRKLERFFMFLLLFLSSIHQII